MARDSVANEGASAEVLVLGAGVAGLSCARALAEHGTDVRVLDKGRGVGGRCATRRIEGQPVDHGLAYYHGDDPGFLAELRSGASEAPLDWPRRVVGEGAPCQPRALRPEQRRLAFAAGVSDFPKRLARGVRVDLEVLATGIEPAGDALSVATRAGERYRARSVLVALPAGQAVRLLRTVAPAASDELAALTELLAGVSMVRCLTVMAGYPAGAPASEWDVCYPQESAILQMVSRDSAKRPAPAIPVFVFQSRPGWSVKQWDEPSAVWSGAMLEAARDVCGDWVTRPGWVDTHRWRYARLTGGDALTAPLLVRLANGASIGVTGEALAAGGGVQAAWLSGRRLARRLLGDASE